MKPTPRTCHALAALALGLGAPSARAAEKNPAPPSNVAPSKAPPGSEDKGALGKAGSVTKVAEKSAPNDQGAIGKGASDDLKSGHKDAKAGVADKGATGKGASDDLKSGHKDAKAGVADKGAAGKGGSDLKSGHKDAKGSLDVKGAAGVKGTTGAR